MQEAGSLCLDAGEAGPEGLSLEIPKGWLPSLHGSP